LLRLIKRIKQLAQIDFLACGIQEGIQFIDQGEIVNILLKIKNSFLPTKQILIGL